MSARLHAPIIGFAMAFLVACAHQQPTLTKADLAGFSMELGFGKEDLNSFEKLESQFSRVSNQSEHARWHSIGLTMGIAASR